MIPKPERRGTDYNFDMLEHGEADFFFSTSGQHKEQKEPSGHTEVMWHFHHRTYRERHHSNRALWRLTGSRGNRLTVFPA